MKTDRLLLPLLTLCTACLHVSAAFPANADLEERIENALDFAEVQLLATLDYLEDINANEPDPARRPYYPSTTKNSDNEDTPPGEDGQWRTRRPNGSFWAYGSFASQLWMMAERADDPAARETWKEAAVTYSEPVTSYTGNDVTVNNYAVFRRWFDQADTAADRDSARAQILQLARALTEPYDRDTNTGRFFEPAGVYGYRRETDADNTPYFHAFIDHSPNVHHLLGASLLSESDDEALRFREVAVSHILTLSSTMGSRRDPGNSGSWQRGYFDWDPQSPTYGEFLFNEGKQGWSNESTWSRGQAWWIYGVCLAYYHTRHPQILQAAREAVRYYVDHLPDSYPEPHRRPGIHIPAWDFDYAYEVDFATEYDTSAAAIAAAGMVRFLAVLPPEDPDYADFLAALTGTLHDLTGPPFLTSDGGPEMSLLRHGCYHHPESLKPTDRYDNGLIWGDYFLVDALTAYQKLIANPPAPTAVPSPQISSHSGMLSLQFRADPQTIYQLVFSPDLDQWEDRQLPVHADSGDLTIPLQQEMPQGFWRLRMWEANHLP